MKRLILAAVAAFGLSGCVTDGYGTGISVGYGNAGYGGYGYPGGYDYSGGYGYPGGYGGYGGHAGGYGYDPRCVLYDRYGRAYNRCARQGYYGSSGYGGYTGYSYYPNTRVIVYPGYSYRNGYYYGRDGRRYGDDDMYRRYQAGGKKWKKNKNRGQGRGRH